MAVDAWAKWGGPEIKEAIFEMARRYGLRSVPVDYVDGVAVDTAGRPIEGAPSFEVFRDNVNQTVNTGKAPDVQMLPGAAQYRGTNQPVSGLAGSEQALQAGLTGQLDTLQYGADIARGDIAGGALAGQQSLNAGKQQAADMGMNINDIVQRQAGASNAQIANEAMKIYGIAGDPLRQAQGEGLTQSAGRFDQAVAPMAGYAQGGNAAFDLQSALSGAYGPQAQQLAYQNFSQSPGQQYLVDQSEKALLRNQAAIGGLGGGNVRQELQQNAIGLAAQDYGNQYNRLAGLSGMGQQAAGQIGQLRGAQAGLESGLISGTGQALGTLAGNLGQNVLGQIGSTNQTGVNIAGQLGRDVLGQVGQANLTGAGLQAQTGQNLGNVAQNMSMAGANAIGNTAGTVGAQRYNAGTLLAQNLGTQNTALANLQNIQGSTLADLYGAYGGNIAGLLQQTGQGISGVDQQLAAILANIATGQGSQAGGLPGIPGIQQGADPLQQIGSAAGGLGGLAMGLAALSDARLKTNIRKVGETAGGRAWYKWDWLIDTDQPAFGVIAQENADVADVGSDGFLRVDYARVS
jgi:hypothetical protein